ncbi:hypothetical protein BHE74_00031587 [Ensete ventricosum]|uniref:Uncharacterized protein n=1 Tax=Ensete ventricosum TaxID=4639 RepID=A0A426XWF1_ENSVE|nr:hypothetical protein B296_00015411 [Ensete ventricosum]RWW61353.1 hypothetical protein BHE74_00031587 [Ensete ventricosum]
MHPYPPYVCFGSLAAFRIPVDAVEPGAPVRPPDSRCRLPHRAAALEPGPERDLPHPVATTHSAFGFQVRKLIPDAAARRVAEAVEGGKGGLHVAVFEPQIVLKRVQHRLARGVDAQVLEGELVVGDVRLGASGVGGLLGEEVTIQKGGEEEELLGEREDEGGEGGDVSVECMASHLHEVTADAEALGSFLILLLIHAPEEEIVGSVTDSATKY